MLAHRTRFFRLCGQGLLRPECSSKYYHKSQQSFSRRFSSSNTKEQNKTIATLLMGRRYRDALRVFENRDFQADVSTFNYIIKVYGELNQPVLVMKTLRDMKNSGIDPNTDTYRSAKSAIPLLEGASSTKAYIPCLKTYTAAISTCFEASEYCQVIQLFDALKLRNLQPEESSYEAILASYIQTKRFEDAIALFKDMKRKSIRIDEVSYSMAISACAKSNRYQEAIELLRATEVDFEIPSDVAYSAALSACSVDGSYEMVISLFKQMIENGIAPNLVSYNAVISACAKRNKHEIALEILGEMKRVGIEPDAATYSEIIISYWQFGLYEKACDLFEDTMMELEKSGHHRLTLDLLDKLSANGISPESLTISAVMAANNRDGKYERDLKLLRDISGSDSDFNSFRTSVTACENQGDIVGSLRILNEAIENHVIDESMFRMKQKGKRVLDLHGFNIGLSRAFVRYFIALAQEHAKNEPAGQRSVVIITGKGNHVLEDGRTGVLRKHIEDFIKNELKLNVQPVRGNPGRLLVSDIFSIRQ